MNNKNDMLFVLIAIVVIKMNIVALSAEWKKIYIFDIIWQIYEILMPI